MRPVSPVIAGFEDREVPIGKNQPEFLTLPAIMARDELGTVVSRWALEPEELRTIVEHGELFLTQLTFGNQFQPILPSVDAPPIPDPNKPAEVDDQAGRPLLCEFRLSPLSLETGNPVLAFDQIPGFMLDLAVFTAAFWTRANVENNQVEEGKVALAIERRDLMMYKQAEEFARIFAVSTGSDCYYRFDDDDSSKWYVIEGTLQNGKHAERTEKPFVEKAANDPRARIIDVALLDVGGSVDQATAAGMVRALLERFGGGFYSLLGYSSIDDPTRIFELEIKVREEAYTALEDVLQEAYDQIFITSALAQEVFSSVEYCVFVGTETGTFLLDIRIWNKALDAERAK